MLTKKKIYSIEDQTGVRQYELRRALNKSLRAGASTIEDKIKKNDILRMPIENFIEEVLFEPLDPMMEPRYKKKGVPHHHSNYGGSNGKRSKKRPGYSWNWSFEAETVVIHDYNMIIKGADSNYYLFTNKFVDNSETDIKYTKINLQTDTYKKIKTKKNNDPRYTEVRMGLAYPSGDKRRKYKGIPKKIFNAKKVAIYRDNKGVTPRTTNVDPKQLYENDISSDGKYHEKKYNNYLESVKTDIFTLLKYYKNNPNVDIRFRVLDVKKRKSNHGPGVGGVPPKYDDIFHDVCLQLMNDDIPIQNKIYDITFSEYRRFTFTDSYEQEYTHTYPSIPQQAVLETASKKEEKKTKAMIFSGLDDYEKVVYVEYVLFQDDISNDEKVEKLQMLFSDS